MTSAIAVISVGAAAFNTGFGVDIKSPGLGLLVGNEIGTNGVAEGADGTGKLWSERGFRILVTDCHNDLGGA